MAVSITICNIALGEVRGAPIADIDEGTMEAVECKRFYPHCLSVLLERFEWSFATRIATLAVRVDNPRASEWRYAYVLPVDVATPKRLVPPDTLPTASSISPPFPVIGQPYIVEDGILYSQVPGAILEYSRTDIPEPSMSAMFKDALAYALAARLVVPLRDNPGKMRIDLEQRAELAVQRAIADDANRQRQRDGDPEDEVARVRSGYSTAEFCR